MSLTVGGVNLFQQTLDNEYRVNILEKIVEIIVNKIPDILSEEEIRLIKEDSLSSLQKKYPEAGIKKGEE